MDSGSGWISNVTKGADTRQLICAFVFDYPKSSVSHDAAHMIHD